MRGTWNTGLKPFGAPLKVHWTFLLWPLMLWSFGLAMGFQMLLILTVSLLFHEYAHVLAAKSVGYETTDVTVYLLGGAAKIPDMLLAPPSKEAFVAVVGPISSFALAAIAFLLGSLLGKATPWFLSYTMLINIVFGIFNLLPLYPMDGGRILRAACSYKMGHERGTKVAVWTTVVLGALLCVLAATIGWWALLVIMPLVIVFALAELDVLKRHLGERR